MREKYKYLSKNVLLFSLSGFVPKILSFILVPLYTGILSTAEYGVSDLITTTVSLLIPIFTCDIQDAVMRYAMDKDYDQSHIFSTGIRIIIKGTLLVITGALFLYILPIHLKGEYLFFTVVMFFTTALSNTFTLFCRAIDQVKIITVSSILNSIITLCANIILLAVIRMGLTGYLIANSLGAAIALTYLFVKAKLYRYIRTDIPKKVSKQMLIFSFPLIFSVIAWWVNNASDRYILTWMSGIAVSGVYAVAYKIPNLLSIFQNIFTQAWSISAIKEFDSEDKDGFIGNMYTLMNFAMVAMCSLIMIVNQPIAGILYAKEFYFAWLYVPPLLISVVFNAMSLFIGSIFTAVKDTKILSVSTIIGALINTILNFVFIYRWGAYGAAIATLIGYAVTFWVRRIILRKYVLMKINNKRDMLGYTLLIAEMMIATLGWKYVSLQMAIFGLIMFIYRVECKKIVIGLKRVFK